MSKARNFDGSSISENNIINVLPIAANDLSPTSRLRQKMNKSAKTPQFQSILMNEFATYENLPIYIGQDILGWWKTHSEMLPDLSKLAQLYLAIPATSTQSERVFSASVRVSSSSRTSLEPGKVEGLVNVIINNNKTLLKQYKVNK